MCQGNTSGSTGFNNEIDEETGLPRGSAYASSNNKLQKIFREGGTAAGKPQNLEDPENNVLNTLYSPQSTYGSPDNMLGREIKIILPPKHVASELIEAVWDNACVLFRFYHRPSFIRDLDLLYETDPDDYTNKQYKILPLVYSVMAVGVLFSMDKCEKLGFKDASEGYKYFVAARKLIDIADARDTYAIQSIVMMIIFLQCSARLSTCYSYIGVALRSALRAGLHRKVAYSFNPIELETRKRLFWTIRKMDIYVNAMLGLPRSIAEEDFDQELPEEIDDENITEDGYFPQKEGKLSSAGIANAHTRLLTILSHIMKHIYPVKQDTSAEALKGNNTAPLYNVAHAKVAEMEAEIKQWLESLPEELKPGANPPPEYLKANRLLHLALCHIQIVLYRPFIHYCSPKFKGDEKARYSALNCIRVSRTAMHIAHDLVSKKLLNGAYWFSIYTIFFSVACLVYYVHENPRDSDAYEIRRDAELGKNALTSLKDSSMSAQRTYNLLNTLFEQLNRRTAKIQVNHNVASNNSQMSNNPLDVSIPGTANSDVISSDTQADLGSQKPYGNDSQSDYGVNSSKASFYSNPVANSSTPNLSDNTPSPSLPNAQPTQIRGKRGRPSGRRGSRKPLSGTIHSHSSLNNSTSANNINNSNYPTSVASTPGSFGTPMQSDTSTGFNTVAGTPISPNNRNINNNPSTNNNILTDILGNNNNGQSLNSMSQLTFDPSGMANFKLDSFNTQSSAPSENPSNAPNNGNNSPSILSADGNESVSTESPHFYVPGIMDQVDAQLFGRFLPPYMLQQSHLGTSSGPHMGQASSSKTTTPEVSAPKPTVANPASSDVGVDLNNLDFNEFTFDVPNNPALSNNNENTNINRNEAKLDNAANGSSATIDMYNASNNLQGSSSNNTSNGVTLENPAIELDASAINANLSNDTKASGSSTNVDNNLNSTEDVLGDRRFSFSTLFSKGWDDLLAQHNELSGLNSFMTQ